jgi:hypothetical protein
MNRNPSISHVIVAATLMVTNTHIAARQFRGLEPKRFRLFKE